LSYGPLFLRNHPWESARERLRFQQKRSPLRPAAAPVGQHPEKNRVLCYPDFGTLSTSYFSTGFRGLRLEGFLNFRGPGASGTFTGSRFISSCSFISSLE